MGEIVAVLNGIEFRTSINNYELKKPVKNKNFHETENVAFPHVPTNVTQIVDLKGQIDEMRELFKAFKDQDDTKLAYQNYFKPVLSYLEGSWLAGEEKEEMLEKVPNVYKVETLISFL